MKTSKVTIETRDVGTNFACCGVIRSVRTGRVLATTSDKPRPNGCRSAAIEDATALAERRGYVVEVAS